jgi:hypothetical protein
MVAFRSSSRSSPSLLGLLLCAFAVVAVVAEEVSFYKSVSVLAQAREALVSNRKFAETRHLPSSPPHRTQRPQQTRPRLYLYHTLRISKSGSLYLRQLRGMIGNPPRRRAMAY